MPKDGQTLPAHELRRQLADLHRECWGWALACCRRNPQVAEDVLHMSYQKVLEGHARFAGQSAFKTWLFGVIRLTALNELRWNVRHWLRFLPLAEQEPATASAGDPDAALIRAEREHAVRTALARLADRQREALHLVFYHDMTLDEAAEVMRVSPGTARTHYERGKAALRLTLGAPEDPR